jgi:subfamily B ATP-binding cassette protein MsbA
MADDKKKISGASLRHAFDEIIWPRRKLIFMGLVLILFNRLSGLVMPASTKYLVDNVIAEGNMEWLYMLLAAVGGAVLIQAVTSYALTMLMSVEAQHLIASSSPASWTMSKASEIWSEPVSSSSWVGL